jgi:hypothetical protein
MVPGWGGVVEIEKNPLPNLLPREKEYALSSRIA